MAAGAQGTYPLDTLRLRMAVDPGARSMRGAAAALLREGSQGAFFRGLGTSLAGVGVSPSQLDGTCDRQTPDFSRPLHLTKGGPCQVTCVRSSSCCSIGGCWPGPQEAGTSSGQSCWLA